MEKYKIVKKLGEGAYGIVVKCINQQTQELVAIKKMKGQYAQWDECLNMPEVQALQKLNNSPFLIKIKEMVHNKKENEVNIVFEYCEKNLYQEMQERSRRNNLFSEAEIKNMMYQALSAVQYMHQNGYMHRDIKPENFLIAAGTAGGQSASESVHLKLADFGLAKNYRMSSGKQTEYVSTRWYRAPELVLRSTNYNQSVDVFALACIMAEMYLGRPIFPGSTETDQLTRIVTVLGTPTHQDWPEGLQLASQKGIKFPNVGQNLRQHFQSRSDISQDAFDLMSKMLKYSSDQRITAQQAMQHDFFRDVSPSIKSMATGGGMSMSQINQRRLQRNRVNKEDSHQTEQNQAHESKDYNMDLDFNTHSHGTHLVTNGSAVNTYLSQPTVPLTQQYLSSKVPEIGQTNSPGITQKAKAIGGGGISLNHRLEMNSKGAASGGSGMTYGMDSSSAFQPPKRNDRGLGNDNYKPVFTNSLRNSGQISLDKPQVFNTSAADSPPKHTEKAPTSTFNPSMSRYGVFANMSKPNMGAAALAPTQTSQTGVSQYQKQPFNLMDRNANKSKNDHYETSGAVNNSRQNFGDQEDILDRMINTNSNQVSPSPLPYQNNPMPTGSQKLGVPSKPGSSFYSKPNMMVANKHKNQNQQAYNVDAAGILQSQSVGILQIPRSNSRLDDNANQQTISNPYQNKENIQKGNYGSSARGLGGVGQNIMGPAYDVGKSDSIIPVIKPSSIIPAKEGQLPKPNQFSNLGQSLIMSSNKAMRQQPPYQSPATMDTNLPAPPGSGTRNQISGDYLDQQQHEHFISQRSNNLNTNNNR